MSKFNPEDFKAPVMEPLSNVTINGYEVEWDKTAKGLIGVFKGVAVRMEGERAFIRVGGDFTDTPAVDTALVLENDDIKLDAVTLEKHTATRSPQDALMVDLKPQRQKMVGSHTPQPATKAECGSRMQMAGRQPVYCRECSCKSCGAPINFYRVDAKTFEEAKYKGKEPNNFTHSELESFFGDVGEIDGVIYDNTQLCSQCRAYDY